MEATAYQAARGSTNSKAQSPPSTPFWVPALRALRAATDSRALRAGGRVTNCSSTAANL